MPSDRYGYELTTSSPQAAQLYGEGLDAALASEAPAEARFAAAAVADPGFALAHIGRARLLQFRGAMPEARAAAATARELAAGATRREQQHVACLSAAVAGDAPGALALLREHVAEFPRDAFVLSQACGVYGLIGFSGRLERNDEQLALLEPLAESYGDDWWFLSQHAFALNELFRHEPALKLAQRALELREKNGHASHTIAHVYFETGDAAAGADFLDGWVADYDPQAQLYGHLNWHLALFELHAGRYDRVLSLYERVIRPSVSTSAPLGAIADAASLLWRCSLTEAMPTGLHWPEVAGYAAKAFAAPGISWADAHCLLAHAAVNDQPRLAQLTDALRERVAAGKTVTGPMIVALADGLSAFGAGEYEVAVQHLEPIAPEVIRLGGSHAQREVFEETLLEAYIRSGRTTQAEQLLTQRLDRRPSMRDTAWLARARREV